MKMNFGLLLSFCTLAASLSFFWLMLSSSVPLRPTGMPDRCTGRYVYVHRLPPKFNTDMIRDCHNLSPWVDMCQFTVNAGLGAKLDNSDGVFSENGWYATNQFLVEVIFHGRMEKYDCLTSDASLASAVFVPFYGGLHIGRYLWGYNTSVRDSAGIELVEWLRSRPEWGKAGGRDHFMVAGRITWDFRRETEDEDAWGTKLFFLPEAKNMTVLAIEASPYHANDVGIPYPTYFHPSARGEILTWQDRMRSLDRPWLFSFAGAPRPNLTESIRDRLIEQCRSSARCGLLECDLGPSKCHSASSVMGTFQRSVFCLQPQGDSMTRRSTFDSMLAGCIPVFFHPGSAYVQYLWHLPRNYTEYSVFIPEDEVREGKINVEEVLSRFGREEVNRMREEVIGMIPSLVYGDPRVRIEGVRDAFDVAVEGVIERIGKMRGEEIPSDVEEQDSWKYGLVGRGGGKHEWDHFFDHHKS